jgi:hypothetical protein
MLDPTSRRSNMFMSHPPNFSIAQLEQSLELKEKKKKKQLGNAPKGFDLDKEKSLLTFYEQLTTETLSCGNHNLIQTQEIDCVHINSFFCGSVFIVTTSFSFEYLFCASSKVIHFLIDW